MSVPPASLPVERELPFLDHLEELRRVLLRCLAVLALGVAAAIPLTPWALGWLLQPLKQAVPIEATALWSMDVGGAFTVTMRLALWTGLFLSTPILILLLAGFVFPGLTARERHLAQGAGIASCLLFFLGGALAHGIVLPLALRWLYNLHDWLGVRPQWTVTSYVAFAGRLLLAFGAAFQMPVIVMALGGLGLLTRTQLAAKRRHVIVGLLVVAALLTPPDVGTQLLLAVPLIILYEVCIWLLGITERRYREIIQPAKPL